MIPLGIVQHEGDVFVAPFLLQQSYDAFGRANQVHWYHDQRGRCVGGKERNDTCAGTREFSCFAEYAIAIVLVEVRVTSAADEKLCRRRGSRLANVIDERPAPPDDQAFVATAPAAPLTTGQNTQAVTS